MVKDPYANAEETLPYDLRQVYALDLVGEHLKDIARARKADSYVNYFKSLKDLWIITQHKIKERNTNAPKEWKIILNKAVDVLNEYPRVFSGENKKSAIGISEVERVLNEVEMFLYDSMEKAKIFGTKWDDDGL